MLYDFHTHTFLSDGALSPLELIQRAFDKGYRAIALTDHVGVGSLSRVVDEVKRDCVLAEKYWNIVAIPGVELTYVPPPAIDEVARLSKSLGAKLVVIHGETIVEPVEQGTNKSAVESKYVDILAHPGLLTPEEATLAAKNGVFIEISARKGHSLTNGHVVKIAQMANAKLLVNSDAHDEDDLLTQFFALNVGKGAGLTEEELNEVLEINPQLLLDRIGISKKLSLDAKD
jgi:histidinol phosphatase-like PHP family hydrolase